MRTRKNRSIFPDSEEADAKLSRIRNGKNELAAGRLSRVHNAERGSTGIAT